MLCASVYDCCCCDIPCTLVGMCIEGIIEEGGKSGGEFCGMLALKAIIEAELGPNALL